MDTIASIIAGIVGLFAIAFVLFAGLLAVCLVMVGSRKPNADDQDN